jgi:Protein of unknown function (DUF2924)
VHDKLSEQIAILPSLNKAKLLAIWAENFSKDPPPNLRKELMVPLLAYRIQEREFGGLSNAGRKKLKDIAQDLDPGKRPHTAKARLKPGTRLFRSWQGQVHEVSALAVGFEYQGKHFKSLSTIAREITGTRWSGPLFFGTKKDRP